MCTDAAPPEELSNDESALSVTVREKLVLSRNPGSEKDEDRKDNNEEDGRDDDAEDDESMTDELVDVLMRHFFIDVYRPRCSKILADCFTRLGPSIQESHAIGFDQLVVQFRKHDVMRVNCNISFPLF